MADGEWRMADSRWLIAPRTKAYSHLPSAIRCHLPSAIGHLPSAISYLLLRSQRSLTHAPHTATITSGTAPARTTLLLPVTALLKELAVLGALLAGELCLDSGICAVVQCFHLCADLFTCRRVWAAASLRTSSGVRAKRFHLRLLLEHDLTNSRRLSAIELELFCQLR